MKFYIYKAYNLCIASELLLPELIVSEGKPDITIRFGKRKEEMIGECDISEASSFTNNGQNLLGEVPEVGKFLIRDGQEIVVNPLSEVDEALLRTVILGPILCILLRQRGLLVLHASCININQQAIAFMGGSGWGKSTLATAFHTQGYSVLTDDVMPLDINAEKALVFPSYPQFKVFPEVLNSLGQKTSNLSPIHQNSSKLSYKFTHGFQQKPIRLHRIYVLAKGDEHNITKMQNQEAFVELVRHTRAMNAITNQDFVTSHLHLCSKLIKNVTFSRFHRKPGLEYLPHLVKLVEEDIMKANDIKNTDISVSNNFLPHRC